jgi:hypothetical protein
LAKLQGGQKRIGDTDDGMLGGNSVLPSRRDDDTAVTNKGDGALFFMISPVNDPEAIDAQVNQVKLFP